MRYIYQTFPFLSLLISFLYLSYFRLLSYVLWGWGWLWAHACVLVIQESNIQVLIHFFQVKLYIKEKLLNSLFLFHLITFLSVKTNFMWSMQPEMGYLYHTSSAKAQEFCRRVGKSWVRDRPGSDKKRIGTMYSFFFICILVAAEVTNLRPV